MRKPDGTGLRERALVAAGRAKLWVLVDASRWLVTGAIVSALFVSLVALGAVAPVPLDVAIVDSDPIETLFQAFVMAIITGVTLVVTISQLVLSQELGPLDEQRERMAGAMAFRGDVEERTGAPVVPAEPAAFLDELIESARARAEELRAAATGPDDRTPNPVRSYVEDVVRDADRASDELRGTRFGSFELVFAVLDFDYSWKIHEGRRLRAVHGDALDDEAREVLDDLLEVLSFFAPARGYFKTLYFEWELIDLSRAILFASMPALVVAIAMILYVDDPGTLPGTTLGVSHVVWITSAGTALAILPFALLLSFVLRIATVTKRTLAIGPFVLRETVPSELFGREE